ncbi:MAG: GNAT family N-acetyltransferase [Pseudomonadales bacterium]|nr:GNAT family N-acetyltransferase [Pseudomonadales bacterium]
MSYSQRESEDFVLSTARLGMRQAVLADAEFMLQLLTEPAWQKFISKHEVSDVEGAINHLKERIFPGYEEGKGFWVVIEKSENKPVGICGLVKRPYLSETDLGFAFLEKYWGTGFARESAMAVMDYGKDTLKLKRLLAITLQENVRSVALLKKLGFVFSDTFIDPEGEEVAMYEKTLNSSAGVNLLGGKG